MSGIGTRLAVYGTLTVILAGCIVQHAAAQRSDRMLADSLNDDRIVIESVVCYDWTGCKSYQIALDRNGRGEMQFTREGTPQKRIFFMTPYDFRRLQAILEPLRPINELKLPCELCAADREATTVIWQSDKSTPQRATFESFPHQLRPDVEVPLLKAQNLLLSALAPNITAPPPN
jgi:hypothetical protein